MTLVVNWIFLLGEQGCLTKLHQVSFIHWLLKVIIAFCFQQVWQKRVLQFPRHQYAIEILQGIINTHSVHQKRSKCWTKTDWLQLIESVGTFTKATNSCSLWGNDLRGSCVAISRQRSSSWCLALGWGLSLTTDTSLDLRISLLLNETEITSQHSPQSTWRHSQKSKVRRGLRLEPSASKMQGQCVS